MTTTQIILMIIGTATVCRWLCRWIFWLDR